MVTPYRTPARVLEDTVLVPRPRRSLSAAEYLVISAVSLSLAFSLLAAIVHRL